MTVLIASQSSCSRNPIQIKLEFPISEINRLNAPAFTTLMIPVLVNSLDMLLPQEIPSENSITDWTLRHAFLGTLLAGKTNDVEAITNLAMAQELERVLHQMPAAGTAIADLEGQLEDVAHDAYFQLRRVKHDEPAVLVRAVLSARLIFLKEVEEGPIAIAKEALEQIDRAFADLLSCLFGGKVNVARHVTAWQFGETCQPMRRWVRGHLVFAALTQGLIVSFRSLAQALRAGDSEQVQRWADLSISLLDGSAGAFILTGDFPPEEYENTIRPSMTPPASPVGLSGLMSADHRYLAQTMRDMRPALKSLAEQEPERHDRITAALSGVYDSHIHVCERFVGRRPSILTAGRTERSGPSLVEQFKTLRLKPFEQAQRAPRLSAERPRVVPGQCPFHK